MDVNDNCAPETPSLNAGPLASQFNGRKFEWGGVNFVSETLNKEQIAELKRLHKWEQTRRVHLLDTILVRPAMFIGVGDGDPRFLLCITTVIEWSLRDLCEITTDKHFRDFFNNHGFGALGLGKVVDKNKPWKENAEELKRWIKLFLDWLESPLDRMNRMISEPD